MRIKLKRSWITPRTSTSRGFRLRKGIHDDVDNSLRKWLPKTARVLDEDYKEHEEESPDTFSEMNKLDLQRAAAEAEGKIHAEAQADYDAQQAVQKAAAIKLKRQEALVKARAAKKINQEKANA